MHNPFSRSSVWKSILFPFHVFFFLSKRYVVQKNIFSCFFKRAVIFSNNSTNKQNIVYYNYNSVKGTQSIGKYRELYYLTLCVLILSKIRMQKESMLTFDRNRTHVWYIVTIEHQKMYQSPFPVCLIVCLFLLYFRVFQNHRRFARWLNFF